MRAQKPATGGRWSHKSIAVLAGLGSFGLHHLIITDAGCAGRLGSLVLDAKLPRRSPAKMERCPGLVDGSRTACVRLCPVSALDDFGTLDKPLCWERLKRNANEHRIPGLADGCGKCSVGPCALSVAGR